MHVWGAVAEHPPAQRTHEFLCASVSPSTPHLPPPKQAGAALAPTGCPHPEPDSLRVPCPPRLCRRVAMSPPLPVPQHPLNPPRRLFAQQSAAPTDSSPRRAPGAVRGGDTGRGAPAGAAHTRVRVLVHRRDAANAALCCRRGCVAVRVQASVCTRSRMSVRKYVCTATCRHARASPCQCTRVAVRRQVRRRVSACMCIAVLAHTRVTVQTYVHSPMVLCTHISALVHTCSGANVCAQPHAAVHTCNGASTRAQPHSTLHTRPCVSGCT